MKICTRCGKQYNEDLKYCPNCGLGDQLSTYRIKNETKSTFTSSNIKEKIVPKNRDYTAVSNQWKVFFTCIICLVPFVGQIIGLITGVYYIKQRDCDTKQFGKSIIVLSTVLLLVSICFTIIFGIVYNQVLDDIQYFYQQIQ